MQTSIGLTSWLSTCAGARLAGEPKRLSTDGLLHPQPLPSWGCGMIGVHDRGGMHGRAADDGSSLLHDPEPC